MGADRPHPWGWPMRRWDGWLVGAVACVAVHVVPLAAAVLLGYCGLIR